MVYILSDGEATDGGTGATDAQTAGVSWRETAAFVDAGAVLGYGSESGGSMRSFDGTGTGDFIADPDTGAPAVSVPDTAALTVVAKGLGLEYIQRDGTDDEPTSAFTDLDIAITTAQEDGRERFGTQHYLTWPLGVAASLLLIWELVHLAAAERGLRRLTRPVEDRR